MRRNPEIFLATSWIHSSGYVTSVVALCFKYLSYDLRSKMFGQMGNHLRVDLEAYQQLYLGNYFNKYCFWNPNLYLEIDSPTVNMSIAMHKFLYSFPVFLLSKKLKFYLKPNMHTYTHTKKIPPIRSINLVYM